MKKLTTFEEYEAKLTAQGLGDGDTVVICPCCGNPLWRTKAAILDGSFRALGLYSLFIRDGDTAIGVCEPATKSVARAYAHEHFKKGVNP